MSDLRSGILDVLQRAEDAGGLVVSIAAVRQVVDRDQPADVPALTVDMRSHLRAAAYGHLYDSGTVTILKSGGTDGTRNTRRAQLIVVERALTAGWIERTEDGRYLITDDGRAALDGDR